MTAVNVPDGKVEVDAGEGADGADPLAVRAGEAVDLESRGWAGVMAGEFMSIDARNDGARARWAWTAGRGGVLPTPRPGRSSASSSFSCGASPSGCGCRRRCRSSTQRPRTPRERPADLGAVELGAGDVDRLEGGGGDRQHALAAERLGSRLVLGDEAERGQHRRRQHCGQRAIAGGGGVEPVGTEQERGRRGELRPEHRTERDGPAATLEDGDGLGRGQPPRPGAGDLLERRRDRLHGAEVGAGADHDRHPGLLEPAHGLGQVADRSGGTDPVGDVVGADQQHRDVRLDGQCPVELPGQVGGAGADLGERAQVDPPVGALRGAAGQQRAGRLLDPLHAVAGRARVAEQHDLDRGTGPAAAVPAGRVGRRHVAGLADGVPGELRLGPQDAVEGAAEHGEAAPAVRRGGGELACCPGLPHGSMLRTGRLHRLCGCSTRTRSST